MLVPVLSNVKYCSLSGPQRFAGSVVYMTTKWGEVLKFDTDPQLRITSLKPYGTALPFSTTLTRKKAEVCSYSQVKLHCSAVMHLYKENKTCNTPV